MFLLWVGTIVDQINYSSSFFYQGYVFLNVQPSACFMRQTAAESCSMPFSLVMTLFLFFSQACTGIDNIAEAITLLELNNWDLVVSSLSVGFAGLHLEFKFRRAVYIQYYALSATLTWPNYFYISSEHVRKNTQTPCVRQVPIKSR